MSKDKSGGKFALEIMDDKFIGKDPAIVDVRRLVRIAAQLSKPVLIVGESGTGKDMVAEAIHENSQRKDKKYIAVNCGAVAESLLESELFGHVRGAFTGADYSRKGHFKTADGGTLFLDEIESASSGLQVKLLRAVERGEIMKVGSSETEKVDTRIIAASKVGLLKLVGQGKFRNDLYYRLNVLTLYIPPLRDRAGDIRLLVDHFLGLENSKGSAHRSMAQGAINLLQYHTWPGNVRELGSVIERLCVYSSDDTITAEDVHRHGNMDDNQFSTAITQSANQCVQTLFMGKVKWRDAKAAFEKQYLLHFLKAYGGKVPLVSEVSGLSRAHIYELVKKHRINIRSYNPSLDSIAKDT